MLPADTQILRVSVWGVKYINPLGKLLNKWYVFYDDVRRPVTPDLIGELCVVGLANGQILVKGIEKNHQPGHYDLVSNDEREPKIVGVKIEWAAKVKEMRPR